MGERVLVIDDSLQIHEVLRDLVLEPQGYQVLSAYDGREGLRLVLEQRPDLIILDERMPHMTGVEVLEALREQGIQIPVIFTTIHGSEDLVVRVFRLGVRDYVIKPFDTQEMQQAVERVLTESRLRAERDRLLKELREANMRLERQVQEMHTLYSIGRSVTSLLDLDAVFKRVVEAAVFVTRAEEALLMLMDKTEEEMFLRAAKNLDEDVAQNLRVRVDDSLVGRVVYTGQAVLVAERQTKIATGYLVKALVYVPIRSPDRGIIGVLGVTNRRSNRSFTDHEVRVLSALAAYAAVALENARLYEEVRRQAEELAAALARSQELERLKSEFIQNVSHELRSPLALIQGYAELLASGELGELDAQQKRSVEIIARRTRMLGELVTDITLILETETQRLRPEPVALDELVQAVVDDFRVTAEQCGLTLRAEIAPHMPPVRGEATHLRRVLDNLLSNAIKFTPKGSITVRVWQEGPWATLVVADTGIGIPDDHKERIFERFYQIDGSSKRRYGGVGLGLALVKEIIEAHGGKITVESEVGKGSTFTAILPLYQDHQTS